VGPLLGPHSILCGVERGSGAGGAGAVCAVADVVLVAAGGCGRGRAPGGCAAAGTVGVDGAGLAAPVSGRPASHVLAQDDGCIPGGGTWVKPGGIGTFSLARLAAVGGSHCRFTCWVG
jgi:hypothetical protein